ncbi:MAG: restriction endonuclease [Anaerolineae bacterium]|nr:restriction endonuclease [Anaerolineae bacterium]
MPIPDYEDLMLPFLSVIQDGNIHLLSDIKTKLVSQFGLSSAELSERLPAGGNKFDNKIGWASTHLKKGMLVESVGRGSYRITNRGLETLRACRSGISIQEQLSTYKEFNDFRKSGLHRARGVDDHKHDDRHKLIYSQTPKTPEEVLEDSYRSIRSALADNLLEQVKACSPAFFETLVIDLLVAMGYGGSREDAGQAIGRSGDGGIDGIIKEDKLGLDVIYVQAKRWDTNVGRPIVQAFTGSLEGKRARKGVLITTSRFSPEALDFVDKIEKRIVLIDGEELAQLMIDYNVGVTEVSRYITKRIDYDYFEEG